MKVPVQLTINGAACTIDVEPRRTLADAIRKDCGLTGTHVGCEHGVCGSCTVIVDGQPVRSCLMFAVQAEGCAVTTVEGLPLLASCPDPGAAAMSAPGEAGSRAVATAGHDTGGDGQMHPLQQAFMQHHGLQCGFCTPGFLMLAAAVLQRDPHTSDEDLIDAMSSNLCRCTGYQGIVDAVLAAARAMRGPNTER